MDTLKFKIFNTIKSDDFLGKLIIVSFGLFPILPNSIKGLPVALLTLNTLFIIFKKKLLKNNTIYSKRFLYTLLMIGIYIFYLFSSFYSENTSVLIQKLETSLSLLLIPIGFLLVTNNMYLKYISYFKTTFIISTIVFIVFFWTYILFNSSVTSLFSVSTNVLREKIDVIPIISLHPIYASMIFSVSILFLLSLWRKVNNYLFIFAIIILNLNLIILASKMAIIAFFIIIIYYFFKIKQKAYIKITTIFFTLFILIAVIVYTPNLRQRFNELIVPNTYEKVIIWNSTSIRKGINDCSIFLLKNNWIVGYGIGDVQDNLNMCYENKSTVLLEGKYNSHNQYLSIWLGTGIFGILFFLIILGYNFKLALRYDDMLFQVVLIFFALNFLTENLLQRQTGVILFSFLINLFGWNNFNKRRLE